MHLPFSKGILICVVIFSTMFLAETKENSAHDRQNELYFLC